MPPQRKRKAAQLEATTAIEPAAEAVQAPAGLRQSTRRIPVKPSDTSIEHLREATNGEPQLTTVPPEENTNPRAKRKRKAKAVVEVGDDDYRAARWRLAPPQAVVERMFRCRTQRMFVIGRVPVEGVDPPQEKFQMAGTTGNVYTVHITNRPTCK